MLEKKSVINLRLPIPSQEGYDTASLITKTRVIDITLKQLPAQTFVPPKGYNKVKDQAPSGVDEDMHPIVLKQPVRAISPSPLFRADFFIRHLPEIATWRWPQI